MADKKKEPSVFDYLKGLMAPSPDHERAQETMEEVNETTVDRQGNVIRKKKKV